MIKRVDEAYGRLMDCLKSLKMIDDSVVVFTSDHGNNFKTRNNEYKRSCHDSSIRVPTSFYGNVFNGGGRIKELVNILDLHATILDAAGVKNPKHTDGKSLLPLVNRKKINWPEDIFVQISESQLARAIRTKKWKYCIEDVNLDPNENSFSKNYVEKNLYDLESDPYELNNLIGLEAFNEISKQLRSKIKKYIKTHENISCSIEKAKKIKGRGQLGLYQGSHLEKYRKLFKRPTLKNS